MSCDPSVNGIATASNETDYVLGPGGEQVTELAQDANGTMNWQRTYVYAAGAGGLIGTYDPVPNPLYPANHSLPQTIAQVSFRLTDWLGTMRATTGAYGVAQGTCTGLPFGDGVTCSGDIPDNHHFTGKERDAESGNDYFGARYFASSMGRWMSPDWSAKIKPVPYSKLDDPQTLNLYAYLRDNPLAGVDADGHGDREREKPQPSEQTQAQKQNSIYSKLQSYAHPVEDFSKIGGTNANYDHINYSVSSGEVTQYTHVDGDLPNTKDLGTGYSGKGDGVNNPSMENVSGAPGKPVAGPIPEGKYTIGEEQANKLGNGKVLSNSMRLTPDAGNNMYGRGGFLMHGGSWNLTSSEGCIVVPDVNVRNAVGSSGTNLLTVTQ
jgi:RHS repeat-associated protein